MSSASACALPESIVLACQSLDNSIARYIKKRRKRGIIISNKAESSVKEVAKHFKYVVTQLFWKRTSLDFAVKAFADVCCSGCMQALRDLVKNEDVVNRAENVKHVLCHWMKACVRLRDGLVLLQSGECRHKSDVELCRNSKFPSKFVKDLKRPDGITTMYSADFYSGYGWDELFDEQVGIVSRLAMMVLGGDASSQHYTKFWNDISDHAPLLEVSLNECEQSIKTLHQQFETHRDKFLQSVKSLIASHGMTAVLKTTMVDKMERLELRNAKLLHIQVLRIEREAGKYQVTDSGGVLPSVFTYADWKEKMMLPSLLAPTKDKTVGLKATLELFKEEVKQLTDISCNKIKAGFGVNPQDLQASLEHVEGEGRASASYWAMHEEQAILDNEEVKLLEKEVFHCKQDEKKFREILKEDSNQAWNANERLRETLMIHGSMLLKIFKSTKNIEKATNIRLLNEAVSCFSEALAVISELDKLNPGISGNKRELLVSRGKAHKCLGKTYLNLARYSTTAKEDREVNYKKSKEQLTFALQNADEMRALSDKGAVAFSIRSESLIQKIQAAKLECSAKKWLGVLYWDMGDNNEGIRVLHEASGKRTLFPASHPIKPIVQKAYMDFLQTRHSAANQFAELATTEAKKSFALPLPRKERVLRSGTFVNAAIQCYRRSHGILREVNDMIVKYPNIIKNHLELPTEHQLRAKIKELEEWQKQIQLAEETPLQPAINDKHSKLHRSDVPADLSGVRAPPTAMFTATTGIPFKKKRRAVMSNGPVADPFLDHEPSPGFPEGAPNPLPQIQYRKWGDELLPRAPDGSILHEFPACFPPPLPEMLAIIFDEDAKPPWQT